MSNVGPDYGTLRSRAGFRWYVAGSQSALRCLADIPIREFNLRPSACIEAYRTGRPRLRELFGPDVELPAPAIPYIAYGHVNTLGSQLIFPDNGEVGHTHVYDSLEEAARALERPVDFAAAGMVPFYREFQARMQAAFPHEKVGFSFGMEGPVTTAWSLRGEGFFCDLFDRPDLAHRFLGQITASLIDYHGFTCRLQNTPAISPEAGMLGDDLAALIPPNLWPEFVLPYWEDLFRAKTTGSRSAHVENLRPDHLPNLERAALSSYDPSVSPRLNPKIIAERCRVPFCWLLESFQYRPLNVKDVEDFVYQAAADGASCIFTNIMEIMCNEPAVRKVRAFIEAALRVKQALDAGAGREEIAGWVSPMGRKTFWSRWPK